MGENQVAISTILMICLCFFLAACANIQEPQTEVVFPTRVIASDIEGRWRMVDDRMAQAGLSLVWTFENGRVIVSNDRGDIFSESRYRIDPSQTPGHITTLIRDSGGEENRLGIFRIEGNTLLLAWTMEEGVRPTGFQGDFVSRFERMYE